jgi:6-pyruvoyl-tetrahydropterin synthase
MYEYLLQAQIKKIHANLPYEGKQHYGESHSHDFVFEITVKSNNSIINFGNNNYEINTVEVQDLFKQFLEELNLNLNKDKLLGQTSCTTEDLTDYISIYFIPYLKEKGIEYIEIERVSVWEDDRQTILTKPNFPKQLKKLRKYYKDEQ